MMFGGLGTRGGQFGVKLFVSVLVCRYIYVRSCSHLPPIQSSGTAGNVNILRPLILLP